MKHLIRFAVVASAAAAGVATPAAAERVITTVNADLTGAPFLFSFRDGQFTFGSTGDPFNPISVATGGSAQISSFFGEPSSSFVDRGTVVYGPDFGMFSAFPSTTTARFTLGDNFFGLRATSGGLDYYGFAFTTNAVLNSYGFETVAGRAVTATTEQVAAVPEPATWAMMVLGFGTVGYRLRRRAKVRVAMAA